MADSTAPTTPTKAISADDYPPSPRRSTRVRKPTFKALDAANQHNKAAPDQHNKNTVMNQQKPAANQRNKPAAATNQDKPTAADQAQHDDKPAANDATKRAPSPTTSEPPLKRPRYKFAGPFTRHRASLTPRPRVKKQHTPPSATASSQPTTAAAASSSRSSHPPPSTPRSHHCRTASRDNANYHLNKGPAYLSSPDRKRGAAENKEMGENGEEFKGYSDWEYGGPTGSRVRNAALGGFGAFFFAPYDGTVGGGGAESGGEVEDVEEEMEGGEEGAVADIVTGKVNRGYGDLLSP